VAIEFARIEIVGRSKGGSACRKSAYNARIAIQDEREDVTYNFARKGDNVYHAVLLPSHVDRRFQDPRILMNEVEYCEKRKNSQLLKDVVIALPDDKELNLNDRIAITHKIIEEMGWVKNGLGVQVDIHQPHDGEKNWHAHLLITTRRFSADGTVLGAKAVNLNPEFRKVGGKAFIIPETQMIHERARNVINNYFAKLGLENRVDPIAIVPQQHVRRVRTHNAVYKAAKDNKLRRIANIEAIRDSNTVLMRITRQQSIFTERDIFRAVKEIPDVDERVAIVNQVLANEQLVKLYYHDGKDSKYYTTKEIRGEELRLLRVADKVHDQINYNNSPNLQKDIDKLDKLNISQKNALHHILLADQGIRILRGRAGTGKSHILAAAHDVVSTQGKEVVGLAPTHKAVSELRNKGYQDCNTVKGFLFKLYNGKATLEKNSMIVVDEAAMVGTADYLELFKVAQEYRCNLILAGDERQLTSIDRGGMFAVLGNKFGSYTLKDIKRQSQSWGQKMAQKFSEYDVAGGLAILESQRGLKIDRNLNASMNRLINDWKKSRFDVSERLIITVRNKEVDSLNKSIRGVLKASGKLTGEEYRRTVTGGKSPKQDEDYAIGDRIIFRSTDKRFNIENGEFASLVAVSKDKFTAVTDLGKQVSFDPTQTKFKHGYATTIYKAQGTSIKDVYVLHDNVGNNRNTYVAMTRHVDEVKLYTNRESTRNMSYLISQLGRANDRLASINLMTHDELSANKAEKHSRVDKVSNWFKSMTKNIMNNISDKFYKNKEYYSSKTEAKSKCQDSKEIVEVVAIIAAKPLDVQLPVNKELIASNQQQVRDIELALMNSGSKDNLHKFKHQVRVISRFTTAEDVQVALQTYKQEGINSFVIHADKVCAEAINSKITTDLKIMEDKFNPNVPLNGKRLNDIVITDFKGKKHDIAEDYLAAIGRDKQVMHYINPQSSIAESIQQEMSERVQQNYSFRIKR